MFNYYLGAALVAAPFFIKEGVQTTTVASQELFLVIVAMVGALVFGTGKPHKNIKAMCGLLFLSAFTTVNPFGAFQYYQLLMSIAGIVFLAVVYANKKEIDLSIVKNCLAAVCIVESLWILLQMIDMNPHVIWFAFLDERYNVVNLSNRLISGSLGNINHSAALIACTLPFLRPVFWLLPLTVLAISDSTMPVITAIIGITCLFSYKSKNYLFIISGLIALFLAAIALLLGLTQGSSYLSDTNRLKTWTLLLKEVGPTLNGKGFGYISEIFSRHLIGNERFYQAHNEWIELYAIGGLLAVGVGIYLIMPVFKNKGNAEINACLIALLVNSLGNFTFHIAPLFMIFGTCYALQLSKDK